MLKVKGDSRAALGAIGKMRSPSSALNAVVRELALDLAQSSFQLGVLEHVAGVDNKVPDFLSRRSEPGAAKIAPPEIQGLNFTKVEMRIASWWKTWVEFEACENCEVGTRLQSTEAILQGS